MTLKLKRVSWLLLILLAFVSPIFQTGTVLATDEVPSRPTHAVVDTQGVLTRDTLKYINDINNKWAQTEVQPQIGVYITDSFEGSIENIANATAREWKIGYDGSRMGMLLVVAIDDREYRLETSDNLTMYFADIETSRLMEKVLPERFKEEDYDGGVRKLIEELDTIVKTELSTQEQLGFKLLSLEKKKEEEAAKNDNMKMGMAAAVVSIMGVFVFFKGKEYKQVKDNERRSQYGYDGPDKLTILDRDFVENDSWGVAERNSFKDAHYLERSQKGYEGEYRAILPGTEYFVDNDTWSEEEKAKLIEEERLRKEKEHAERLERSRYEYDGRDKIYPESSGFVSNETWSAALIAMYLQQKRALEREERQRELVREYEREQRRRDNDDDWSRGSSGGSSSGSSGGWSGGGFSGGGSSGSW